MARGAKLAACFFPPLDPRCLGQNGYSHERDNHPGQRSRGEGAAAGEAPRKGGFRLEAPLPEARAREDRVREKERSPTPPGPRGTGAGALWRFGRPPHRKGRRAHPQTCPGAASASRASDLGGAHGAPTGCRWLS